VERPAGAEEHAQVEVLRLGDDTFVEHEAGLLRDRVERPLAYLRRGGGGVTDLEERSDVVGDPRCRAVPREQRGLAGLDHASLVLRDAEAIGERLVQRLGGVERHGRTHELQEQVGRHRESERVERAVDDLEGRALVVGRGHLAEEAGEQPVDHERRGVLDEDAGLLQRLAESERGGQRGIVGLLGASDLEERHEGDRVEEVEAHDALGVLEVLGHRGDGQRGGVGEQHAGVGDDSLDLGENLLLDLEVLEHRLDHDLGVGEDVLGGGSGHQGAQPVCLVVAEPALGGELVDLAVDIAHALVDASLVEVGEDHRHLEPLDEQQRELAGHETGTDHADLGDRTRELLVGHAHRSLGATLHEVE